MKNGKLICLMLTWSFVFPNYAFSKVGTPARKTASLGIEAKLEEHFEKNLDVMKQLNLIFETVPKRGSSDEVQRLDLKSYMQKNPDKVVVKFADDIMNGDVEIRLKHPVLEQERFLSFSIGAYHIERNRLLSARKFSIDLEGDAIEQQVKFDQLQKALVDQVGHKLEKDENISEEIERNKPIIEKNLNLLTKAAIGVATLSISYFILKKMVGYVPENVKNSVMNTKSMRGHRISFALGKDKIMAVLGKHKKAIAIILTGFVVAYTARLVARINKQKKLEEEALKHH